MVWDHAISRGRENDQWGFITHVNDPISLMYFRFMNNTFDSSGDGDVANVWWKNFTESLWFLQSRHDNLHTFFMEGSGHCTFGWNDALKDDLFDNWARKILLEATTVSSPTTDDQGGSDRQDDKGDDPASGSTIFTAATLTSLLSMIFSIAFN